VVTGAALSGDAVVRTAAVVPMAAAPSASALDVITRAEWGAPAPTCRPDSAPTLVGAVLHHTAGSNGYATVAQAKQQIRNDAAYHMTGRGWCDLGYNFIVDKWGNIYEGRAGSLTSPVIGVHAGGFNTGTVGISLLGTYTSAPSPAVVDAVARIVGSRLGAYGIDPNGTMRYATANGENSRFTNTTVTLPRVLGHRDVAFTVCPGNGGQAVLGAIRAKAASYRGDTAVRDARAVVQALYQDVLGRGVDPSGSAAWTAALATGTTPGQLIGALMTSPEYAVATVTRDYRDVLGRAPDPVGMRDWSSAITSGRLRSEDLRMYLYSSREFYHLSGGTDEAYVRALYRQILGRSPGAGEVSSWVAHLRRPGSSSIVWGFWGSMESANVRVDAFYQRYLGRRADPSGLATWPVVLLTRGEGALHAHLVDSLEYRNRAVAAAR
jgi:uncharacterized protein with LGFP repeats